MTPNPPPGVEIRRIRADEWPQLRELRLEALKDTPIAFTEVYDEAIGQPDGFWSERSTRGATSDSLATFVAVREGAFVGMTVALIDPQAVNLVGVYVTPAWRGRDRGVTTALFDTAIGWAREVGGDRPVQLFVTDGNERAAAFYRRYGFVPTGATVPYPLDPDIQEIQLELPA